MMRGTVTSGPPVVPPRQQLSTVHVANLSPAIHTDMLRSIFAHFGPIVDIRLVSGGAAGANGPYAFVDYATEAAAEAALSMSGQEFDGRRLRVERARKSEYPPPPKVTVKSQAEIYVGNMAFNTTQEMIRAYFEKFGEVVEVQMVREKKTGLFRGFAFVRFADASSANAATAQAPHLLLGRTINVAASNASNQSREQATVLPQPAPAEDLLGPMPVRVKSDYPHELNKPRRHDTNVVHEPPRSRSPEPLDRYLDGRPKRPRFSAAELSSGTEDKVALVVEQLFDGASKLEEYAAKVKSDTTETCASFGEIASLEVGVPKLPVVQPVFVEFFSASDAVAAAENLSSRTYDGRQLVVRRMTRRELRAEVDAFHNSRNAPKFEPPSRHLEEQVEDLRRQLTRAQNELRDADDKRDAEKTRLRADLAHHAAQHKLLQVRVDELEDELDKSRSSARKDREYHAARAKALVDRAEALERERDRTRF